jgi:hypothetical protein
MLRPVPNKHDKTIDNETTDGDAMGEAGFGGAEC